ncbi:MAG: AGE family epimerase/isomerase [Gemmatimonadaceae bacterium]|nr:AGE family epimerase/isomerase [Gemmatimonadaceae bacterium]
MIRRILRAVRAELRSASPAHVAPAPTPRPPRPVASIPSGELLSGKLALIVGAGPNIGRGIARVLAGTGADLLLTDCRSEPLEERFHDSQHGGYFAIDPHTTAEPPSVAMEKWQNDHVHALEALVAYFAIAPSPLVRERIVETILILSRTVVRSDHASSRDLHSRAWHPDPTDRRVSYGHDVECGWLLLDACDAIGMSPSLLLPHVTAIFGTLLAHGLDLGGGGVCHTGNVGASADDRRKIWWVQAEVLVGSLDLYMRTGLPAAGRVYLEVLQWIDSKQADWTNGEWHDCITASGVPGGKKAAHWKGPYHSGRAMIECLLRVARLSAA